MKKIFIISLFIGFIAIFLSSSFEAKAECNEPSQLMIRDIPITIGEQTCMYRVWLCVYCGVGPKPDDISIEIECVGPLDSNCVLDMFDVHNYLEEIIFDPQWIFDNLCFAGYTPCDYGSIILEGRVPICWKKYNFAETGTINLEGCMDQYICYTKYEICWDPVIQDFKKTIIDGPRAIGEGIPCTDVVPPDPPPGNYSECFQIGGKCGYIY